MPICSIPLSSHLTTICPSIHSFIQPSIYPPPLCPALPPPPFLSSWSIYIYSPSPSHQQPVTTPPSTAAPHCLSCKYVLYIYHLHSYAAILKQNTRSVQCVYTKNVNICMNNAKLLICACVQTGPKGYIYIYIWLAAWSGYHDKVSKYLFTAIQRRLWHDAKKHIFHINNCIYLKTKIKWNILHIAPLRRLTKSQNPFSFWLGEFIYLLIILCSL